MQIALVHQVAAHLLPDALLEEDVVRHDDGGAPARFEPAVDVLEKHELLIARGIRDVVARPPAAALLRAEGRIGENHVRLRKPRPARAQRVAEDDVALDAVQHRVHERKALDVGNELHAVEGLALLKPLLRLGELEIVPRIGANEAVGVDEKPAGAHRRILHVLARLRFHQSDHALDERPRGEVLPCAALGLLRVLLEQPLVEIPEPLGLGAVPVERVDGLDHGAKVSRLPERRRRIREDRLHALGAVAAEVHEKELVKLEELDAVLLRERVPPVALGDLLLGPRLFRHLEKEEVRELGDVLQIRDPVVPQDVAQIPELLDDVLRAWHRRNSPTLSRVARLESV